MQNRGTAEALLACHSLCRARVFIFQVSSYSIYLRVLNDEKKGDM